MIKLRVHIKKYDWTVNCYIAVTHYNSDEIVLQLWNLGCDGETLLKAEHSLRENKLNTGLTYSSTVYRESIMVTSIAKDSAEQFNTLTHEIAHVCVHIANASYINKNSENFAYLIGDLSMALFPRIKHLLCDCCRDKDDYYEE